MAMGSSGLVDRAILPTAMSKLGQFCTHHSAYVFRKRHGGHSYGMVGMASGIMNVASDMVGVAMAWWAWPLA